MRAEVMMGVEFPAMRSYMEEGLESISENDYQWRVWIEHRLPTPQYYDDFTNAINILFDDTMVCEDPDGAVGSILFSDEVVYLRRLGGALEELLRDDSLVKDIDFLNDRRWPAVVRLAQEALSRVRANGSGRGLRSIP